MDRRQFLQHHSRAQVFVRLARMFIVVIGSAWLLGVACVTRSACQPDSRTDYADASHVDDWLRHPVFGDP